MSPPFVVKRHGLRKIVAFRYLLVTCHLIILVKYDSGTKGLDMSEFPGWQLSSSDKDSLKRTLGTNS